MFNLSELKKTHEFLNFTLFQFLILWILILIGVYFEYKVIEQLYNQIIFIYNDITFYELQRSKGKSFEMYYPFIESDNQYKDVLLYL